MGESVCCCSIRLWSLFSVFAHTAIMEHIFVGGRDGETCGCCSGKERNVLFAEKKIIKLIHCSFSVSAPWWGIVLLCFLVCHCGQTQIYDLIRPRGRMKPFAAVLTDGLFIPSSHLPTAPPSSSPLRFTFFFFTPQVIVCAAEHDLQPSL